MSLAIHLFDIANMLIVWENILGLMSLLLEMRSTELMTHFVMMNAIMDQVMITTHILKLLEVPYGGTVALACF